MAWMQRYIKHKENQHRFNSIKIVIMSLLSYAATVKGFKNFFFVIQKHSFVHLNQKLRFLTSGCAYILCLSQCQGIC